MSDSTTWDELEERENAREREGKYHMTNINPAEDGAIKTRRVDAAIAYLRDFPNPTAHLRDFEATGIVERIESLTTQLSEERAKVRRLVEALERYADECDTCGYDNESHETQLANPNVCDEFTNLAASALSTTEEK